MSTELKSLAAKRLTVPAIRAAKGGLPLVCLTAYTAPVAKLLDPHCDILLVGDSIGMVVYGFDSTLPVTLEIMINHGAAVVRATSHALVVVDLPFGSYQASPAQAYQSAARILAETGAAAVKLEGGAEMAETVAFLAVRGVPVMAHVGLMPQTVNSMGGYRAQGRDDKQAHDILNAARKLEAAGAFAIVLEGMVESLAARITRELAIPTIGIGASPACDGQILVTDDMLGLFQDFTPKFVKRYANMAEAVQQAAAQYASDVKTRSFPALEHCFGIKPLATVPSLPDTIETNKTKRKRA